MDDYADTEGKAKAKPKELKASAKEWALFLYQQYEKHKKDLNKPTLR